MSATTSPTPLPQAHRPQVHRPARSACLTLLHCLGVLPFLGIAVAQAADAKAQRDQSAKLAIEVARPAIEALLTSLDEQFARGDHNQYIAAFTPDHAGAMAILGRHIQRLCAMTGERRIRSSKIVGDPQSYPDRTVVRVRHTIEWPQGEGAAGPNRLVEDSYLAVRINDDGVAVPTFAIEMPTQIDCIAGGKFHCPPCNYEIGGVAGFLCVPLRREQALALEAASFYLIGTDVVCDVHVLIPTKPKKATSSALTLASAFAEMEEGAVVSLPSKWSPPMHRANLPADLDAARIVVDLPGDRPDSGGVRTIFHVVQFGGLQHILLLRSTARSLLKHQDAVDSLLSSYMLLKTDCDEAQLAALPLRHHTGGFINGSQYVNDRYRIALTGPKSWRAEHRVGGAVFRVHWTSPNGSQMWLIGHRVPTGMKTWTTETANRWLSHQYARSNLKPAASQSPGTDAGWQKNADKSWRRSCLMLSTSKKTPDSPARRLQHVQVYEDLLLIVDGFGTTRADEDALRAAYQTLKRQ